MSAVSLAVHNVDACARASAIQVEIVVALIGMHLNDDDLLVLDVLLAR